MDCEEKALNITVDGLIKLVQENKKLKNANKKLKKELEEKGEPEEINLSLEDQVLSYERIFNKIRDVLEAEDEDHEFIVISDSEDSDNDDPIVKGLTPEEKLEKIKRALGDDEVDDDDYKDEEDQVSVKSEGDDFSDDTLVEGDLDLEILMKQTTSDKRKKRKIDKDLDIAKHVTEDLVNKIVDRF